MIYLKKDLLPGLVSIMRLQKTSLSLRLSSIGVNLKTASDPVRMFQEYPSIANEAFVASGANVFPVLKLSEMEILCPEENEYDYYKLITGDTTRISY